MVDLLKEASVDDALSMDITGEMLEYFGTPRGSMDMVGVMRASMHKTVNHLIKPAFTQKNSPNHSKKKKHMISARKPSETVVTGTKGMMHRDTWH